MQYLFKFFSYLSKFKELLYEDIIRRKKKTPFLIFISLLFSFCLSRLFVIYFPGKSLFINDYHIHHFYFGVVLIAIAGWIALVTDRLNSFSSIMYGIGLGMALDETGLFLTCGTLSKTCDYWAKATYDIFVVVISLFFAAIYAGPFLRKAKKISLRIFKIRWCF